MLVFCTHIHKHTYTPQQHTLVPLCTHSCTRMRTTNKFNCSYSRGHKDLATVGIIAGGLLVPFVFGCKVVSVAQYQQMHEQHFHHHSYQIDQNIDTSLCMLFAIFSYYYSYHYSFAPVVNHFCECVRFLSAPHASFLLVACLDNAQLQLWLSLFCNLSAIISLWFHNAPLYGSSIPTNIYHRCSNTYGTCHLCLVAIAKKHSTLFHYFFFFV